MPFRQMSGGRHEVVLGPVRRGAFPAVPETPREGSTAADRSATSAAADRLSTSTAADRSSTSSAAAACSRSTSPSAGLRRFPSAPSASSAAPAGFPATASPSCSAVAFFGSTSVSAVGGLSADAHVPTDDDHDGWSAAITHVSVAFGLFPAILPAFFSAFFPEFVPAFSSG